MKWKKIMAVCLTLSVVLAGCGKAEPATVQTESSETQTQESVPEETKETAEETTVDETSGEDVEAESTGDKQVVVYFANWYLGEKAADQGAEVASIPWDKVTYINHAFWGVVPADGTTETSVERRASGEGARTEFKIVSTAPDKDYEDTTPSDMRPDIARNHFAEYAAYSEQYPDVNIMLSIGGWTACGYFSEMAYTEEGRQSFIKSCLDVMDQYEWIDGIDIDWEYPGGSKDGERAPESDIDQGCPIFGTAKEDNVNFATLLSELRDAMDEHFGEGAKKLTACASASTSWTLPMQDWASFAPYLDLINVMTYDLAGVWDATTGHASSAWSAKSAASYFKGLGIELDKVCIGSPMYATALVMKEIPASGNVLGAAIEDYKPNETEIDETQMRAFEEEALSGFTVKQDGKTWVMGDSFEEEGTGWHFAYDEKKNACYMYNDCEDSPYYKWYISYENHLSLQAKLDYINEKDLAGIIVWECSEDTYDHEFISQMADNLITE